MHCGAIIVLVSNDFCTKSQLILTHLYKYKERKQPENKSLCFTVIWGGNCQLCQYIFSNTINHSVATFLMIIFSLITIIISLKRNVDLAHFKYLSWHSPHNTPWGSPISWSALMETLQPVARDGKITSQPKRVFSFSAWKLQTQFKEAPSLRSPIVFGGRRPGAAQLFPSFQLHSGQPYVSKPASQRAS